MSSTRLYSFQYSALGPVWQQPRCSLRGRHALLHHHPVYCHPLISHTFECEKPQIGDLVLEGSSACMWGMVLLVVGGGRLWEWAAPLAGWSPGEGVWLFRTVCFEFTGRGYDRLWMSTGADNTERCGVWLDSSQYGALASALSRMKDQIPSDGKISL